MQSRIGPATRAALGLTHPASSAWRASAPASGRCKRLVALAVDGIDRNAALGVGMDAPAKALAEASMPAGRPAPWRRIRFAGEARSFFVAFASSSRPGRGGREHHVVGRVFVGRPARSSGIAGTATVGFPARSGGSSPVRAGQSSATRMKVLKQLVVCRAFVICNPGSFNHQQPRHAAPPSHRRPH